MVHVQMGWRHRRWKIYNMSEGIYTTGFGVTPFFSKKKKVEAFSLLERMEIWHLCIFD